MTNRNERIRPGSTTASEAALTLLTDKPRYERIQRQAIKSVATLYTARPISDLALKLAIGRAILDVPVTMWTDGMLGHVAYGGINRNTGAPIMTNMQKGQSVSITAAAMLAQFFNYFTDDPTDMTDWPNEDRVAEVAGWIEHNAGFTWSVTAEDLVADPLIFFAKLQRALVESGARSPSLFAERAIHDRLMTTLYTPLKHATWDTRLVIGDRRMSNRTGEKFRFGRDQRVGTDPAGWTPTEISSPEWVLEYGLPRRTAQPLRAWLVTIRDPSWLNIEGDRTADRWIWTQGWDRVIRWLPPFRIGADEQIAAPTTDANTPDGMFAGLYRVFLFTEPDDGSEEIAHALWPDTRLGSDIPDEADYMQLCSALDETDLAERVTIYAGAYVIPASGG